MARQARQKSKTDIYHVILRGINRQQIFMDDEDYQHFIGLMDRYRDISHYEVYAYCLMGNHIHLLIQTQDEPLEVIFRRIGGSFVYWYNLKYQRVGHLFQDRFKSEAVEDDAYFLTVLRYILRNPVKAGICASPEQYPYSSIHRLFSQDGHTLPCAITMTDLAEFITQDNADRCMEITDEPHRGMPDSVAREWILREFGTPSPLVSRETRAAIEQSIHRLSERGVSIRQLSRLTGISKSIIEKALK